MVDGLLVSYKYCLMENMGAGALDGQYRQLHPNPQLEEGAAVGRVPRGANTPLDTPRHT